MGWHRQPAQAVLCGGCEIGGRRYAGRGDVHRRGDVPQVELPLTISGAQFVDGLPCLGVGRCSHRRHKARLLGVAYKSTSERNDVDLLN